MLLKNGHLIDPATKTNEPVDIRVENGTIVELGKDLSAKDNEEVLDLSGLTVAPGLVDTHVHLLLPLYFKVRCAAVSAREAFWISCLSFSL